MRNLNDVTLSQEFTFPEQSTIRRYYVETNSVSRRVNSDNVPQDNLDGLKFYVVARKNYSSVDFPFVVPNLFSNFTTNLGLFGTTDGVNNDFFDRGVTSTEDGDSVDNSPFPTQSHPASLRVSVSPKRSKKVSEPTTDYDDSNFFDQPFEDSMNIDTAVEYIKSQSPEKSPVRLSGKGSFKTKKSPVKSKGSSTVRLSKVQSESLASVNPFLELEDLKSSRTSVKSDKKSSRSVETTNSLYKLDRKPVTATKRGTKGVKDAHESYKVTKKGPYQIVRGPRKVVGLPKPLPPPSPKEKSRKRSIKEKKQELALYNKDDVKDGALNHFEDAFDGGFDDFGVDGMTQDLRPLEDKLDESNKSIKLVRRKSKPQISSSALLNSWYITQRSDSETADWPYEKESVERNLRYPKRSRLPRSQHWVSNFISDGSSLLFLAGVSSKRRHSGTPGHSRTNPQLLPDSSLVLTKDNGQVKLELVDKDSQDNPRQKRISNFLQTLTPYRSVGASVRKSTKRLVSRPSIGDMKKQKRLETSSKGFLTLEDKVVSRGTKLVEKSAKLKKKTLKKNKKRLIKINRNLSVDEALEILKDAPKFYGEGDLKIKFEDDLYTSPSVSGPDSTHESLRESLTELSKKDKNKIKKKEDLNYTKLKEYYNKNLSSTKFDSFITTEDKDNVIYYRCIYNNKNQNEIYYDGLVAFNPMIITTQCRTSDIIIPKNEMLDFGNIKSNFICGYVYLGDNILIKSTQLEEGEGTSQPQGRSQGLRKVKGGDIFFLTSYNDWVIENNSLEYDAHIALTFINV